jgi:hypothetical protein
LSTYYGLHCKPCNSFSGCGTNYAIDQLKALALLSPDIKALYDKDTTGALIITTEFSWHERDKDLIDWLVKHANHNMEIYNEYGENIPFERI